MYLIYLTAETLGADISDTHTANKSVLNVLHANLLSVLHASFAKRITFRTTIVFTKYPFPFHRKNQASCNKAERNELLLFMTI